MKPDFEAIKGRLEAATPGPWHVQEELEDFQEGEPPFTVWRGIYSAAGGLNKGDEYEVFEIADADFIAHAPADISALLGWVEKLEAVREAATAYIDPVGLESDDKWCRLDDALTTLEEAP